jgi:hypothetical protein
MNDNNEKKNENEKKIRPKHEQNLEMNEKLVKFFIILMNL